jgi:hypothetical protein
MRIESILRDEDDYEFQQKWYEGGSWLATPELSWDKPPHHKTDATHKSNGRDWRSSHLGGESQNAAEYVGPQAGAYKPIPWSQQATFGEEDADEPLEGVYLIRGRNSGLVKIGWSKNVYSRLATMQVGSSEELELIEVLEVGRTMEQTIHESNSDLRVRGEWFKPEIIERLLGSRA